MKKKLMAIAAVATLAVSAVTPANAQRGVAAGVAAGLIGGAIIGGALAGPGYYGYGPGYYYGPGYGYYGGPAYVANELRLATAALLGRLWLEGSPGAGLRLSPVHLPYKRVPG
jgi:hypothetical protein